MLNYIIIGILLCAGYGILLLALAKVFGVQYNEILNSKKTVLHGLLFPVSIGTALLLLIAWYFSWLEIAFNPAETTHYWWMWLVPVAMFAGVIVRLIRAKWKLFDVKMLTYLIVGSLLVGLSEELLTRGILVNLITQSTTSQIAIMLISSLVFGILHGVNFLNGQSAKLTVMQVFLTTLMGLAFYTTLIVSGTLWLPIFLHAIYDFSLMVQGGKLNETPERAPVVETALTAATYLLSLFSTIGVLIISM